MKQPPRDKPQRIQVRWFSEPSRKILVKTPPWVSRVLSQLAHRADPEESAEIRDLRQLTVVVEDLPD